MVLSTLRVRLAGWLGLFLLLSAPAWAQFTTAVQDGTVNSASEYNSNEFVTRNAESTGGSWFISWDNTNLYLAKTGGDATTPGLVYFDTNPVQPVTDAANLLGGDALGNLNGPTDYGATPRLPFRADARLYFREGYVEVRFRTGSGSWSAPITTNVSIAVAGNTREIAVNWNVLTGNQGRPAQFNWLAYQTDRGDGTANFRFDQAPGNPSSYRNGNATPPYEYYFTVLSTESGYYPTATNIRPSNLISFTGRRDFTYGSFGSVGVWDFTYDSPGQSLSRSSSDGNTDWAISGALVVSAGTLTFGDASGSGASTAGNLLVTNTGVLNMNSTSKPLNVTNVTGATTSNNVRLTNGGTLTLSSTFGGDLNLNGDFTLSNGSAATTTFNANNRAVGFLGSVVQTVTGPATDTPLTFDFVTVNGTDASTSLVRLASNVRVNQTLTFNRGMLSTLNGTNAYVLDLGTTGVVSGETDTKYLTGFATSTQTVGAGGAGAVHFGNLGLTLTPTGASAELGSTTVTRSRGVGNLRDRSGNQSINRNFRVVPTNTAGPFSETLRLDYLDSEVASTTAEGNLQLFYSTNVPTYPTSGVGTFTQLVLSTLSQSNDIAIRNEVTDFGSGTGVVFTLGDQTTPLPVTLVSFRGQRAASAVRLAWQTGLEIDNAGFSIERQVGAGQWQAIAFVPGAGSSQGQAYTYADAQAPAGQLYYRLRQVDLDGHSHYSPVAAIAAGAPELLALHLSPVPAPAGQASLAVDLAALPAAARILAVYDLQGRLVVQATAPAEATTTDLPVGNLAAGTYLVLVQSGADTYRARFNKL